MNIRLSGWLCGLVLSPGRSWYSSTDPDKYRAIFENDRVRQAILASGLDVAVAGDAAPVAILDRDWVRDAAAETDPARRLATVVVHACEIAARTAAIKEVMRDAAATQPAVRELIEQDNQRRYLSQQALVDLLIERQPLRARVDRRRAVDVFFALVNSQTYQLLVEHLGWTGADWRNWLVEVVDRELFGDQ